MIVSKSTFLAALCVFLLAIGCGDDTSTELPVDAGSDHYLDDLDLEADQADLTIDLQDDADDPLNDADDPLNDSDPDAGLPQVDFRERESFADQVALLEFARTDGEVSRVPFVVIGGPANEDARVHFIDPHFYQFHGDWYLYRLMNGADLPSLELEEPREGMRFESYEELTLACLIQPNLCADFDLQVIGWRLFSRTFYELAEESESNLLMLGSLLHLSEGFGGLTSEERWLFDIVFEPDLDEGMLGELFGLLDRVLPDGVAEQVSWFARSEVQEELAAQIRLSMGELSGRVVRQSDFGEVAGGLALNEGLAAGFVTRQLDGWPQASSGWSDIVLVREMPTTLPSLAALLVTDPGHELSSAGQDALVSRIPVARQSDAASDLRFLSWAASGVPIALRVRDLTLEMRELSLSQWDGYTQAMALSAPLAVELPSNGDLEMPLTLDLSEVGLPDRPLLLPQVGGPATQSTALLADTGLAPPDRPLGITTRAYRELMESNELNLEAILACPAFQSHAWLRCLVLEGLEGCEGLMGSYGEIGGWVEQLLESDLLPSAAVAAIEAGGVRRVVRESRLPSGSWSAIHAAIGEQYAGLSPDQDLRLIPSPTTADLLEYSGRSWNITLVSPRDSADLDSSGLEDALAEIWASYWSFEAIEALLVAGIDPLEGGMGVLVTPHLDDDKVLLNGALSFTIDRDVFMGGSSAQMHLSVQLRTVAATQPGEGAEPERVSVFRWESGDHSIQRLQNSSLSPEEWLLDDRQLVALFDGANALARRWEGMTNSALDPREQRHSATFLIEFYLMDEGWPSWFMGPVSPSRFVVSRARWVEPPVWLPETLAELPYPRNLLAWAARIDERECVDDLFTLYTDELYTEEDIQRIVDVSGSMWPGVEPFTAQVHWEFQESIPGFPFEPGQQLTIDYTQCQWIGHPFMHHGTWDLTVSVDSDLAQEIGLTAFDIYQFGSWSMYHDTSRAEGSSAICSHEILYINPRASLHTLFNRIQAWR